MRELKIRCEHPESVKKLFEEILRQRLKSLEDGIKRTE